MSGCGKILGKYPATLPKCGGFWYGGIAKCQECKDKELDREYKRVVIAQYLKSKAGGE